jgi:predicted amidophosphoribosyltransferase
MNEEEAFGMFWWYSILLGENLVECSKCGKEISEDYVTYCSICGSPLCRDCGKLGLCSACAKFEEPK